MSQALTLARPYAKALFLLKKESDSAINSKMRAMSGRQLTAALGLQSRSDGAEAAEEAIGASLKYSVQEKTTGFAVGEVVQAVERAVVPERETMTVSDALIQASRIVADPNVRSLLDHPHLTRTDAVSLVCPDNAPQQFVDFLTVLAENRRLALIPEIAGFYEQMLAEDRRILKAKVTSAVILPPEQLHSIRLALESRFAMQVQLETAVDESLIGGAVIDAGDVVIDGSLKSKLARLQSALAH